jgi:zinc D-Ala-D-Ala carboxypeptidase
MQKYEDNIREICKRLGIPSEYEANYGLLLQYEEESLVEIGRDIFDRTQYLSKEAAASWNEMRKQANQDSIQLDIVSAFRSVNKQLSIIERKLKQGQVISEILEVNTAPGYSEHHTGRALDITTPGCEPLVKYFDITDAFHWLVENASLYSFSLSYPKGNPCGVAYEPWHWAYCK